LIGLARGHLVGVHLLREFAVCDLFAVVELNRSHGRILLKCRTNPASLGLRHVRACDAAD
jgi:hypothetical protein